jgi:hypothetical protein
MLHTKLQGLVMKFLMMNYPVRRLKKGRHFKRTIVLERGTYLLSNKEDQNKAVKELSDIVELVFDLDNKTSNEFVETFLNTKRAIGSHF